MTVGHCEERVPDAGRRVTVGTVTGNKTTASPLASFARRKKADCFQTRICFHRHGSLAFSLLLSPSPPPPPAPPPVPQSSRSVVGSSERDLNTRRRTFSPFFPCYLYLYIFYFRQCPRPPKVCLHENSVITFIALIE